MMRKIEGRPPRYAAVHGSILRAVASLRLVIFVFNIFLRLDVLSFPDTTEFWGVLRNLNSFVEY